MLRPIRIAYFLYMFSLIHTENYNKNKSKKSLFSIVDLSFFSCLARDPLSLWGGQVVVAPEGAALLPGGQRTEES